LRYYLCFGNHEEICAVVHHIILFTKINPRLELTAQLLQWFTRRLKSVHAHSRELGLVNKEKENASKNAPTPSLLSLPVFNLALVKCLSPEEVPSLLPRIKITIIGYAFHNEFPFFPLMIIFGVVNSFIVKMI